MIISVDQHVGLPFLEGLCDDLKIKMQQPKQKQTQTSRSNSRVWLNPATRAMTILSAMTGALLALR